MFATRLAVHSLRQAARTLSRRLPSSASRSRPLQQKRFASYQRFPSRGGSASQGGEPRYSNFKPVRRLQYIWYNYRTILLVGGAGSGTFYVLNLEEVPVSHRRRFNWISPETEKRMLGDSGYEQILRQYRGQILPPDHPSTQLVAKVVQRLLPSTRGLVGEDWKVHVIDDPDQKNAFVLPGGKVFVFTGILKICQNEDGVAAVLGHEIAHNVAHHVAERLSRSAFVMPLVIMTTMLFDISGSVASSVMDLISEWPNSRTQEAEADHLGVLMMAESCYDPQSAVDFWNRMKEANKGAPPQFLSTHPSDYNRMQSIRRWLPEAQAKYDSSECGITSGYAKEFQKAFGGSQQYLPPTSQPQNPGSRRDDDDFW